MHQRFEAAGRHDVEVNALVDATVKDTTVIRDTVKVIVKTVNMDTPYIKLDGIIEDNHLKGNIHLPVHLHQAFWVEYKHRFLWWRWKVKAIHQTISSDNPYVEIKYTEFINLKNKFMLFRKSFQTKIDGANRVFTTTVEKLKNVQVDITTKIEKNHAKVQKLTDENVELESMKTKTKRQIEDISKFIV